MSRFLHFCMLIAALSSAGCNEGAGGYQAVSVFSGNGFVINEMKIKPGPGGEVKLWGFVDHHNIYGDAGVRSILGDWWSGEGPTPATWRFNLKGRENDEV